jgi:hypothetical protein
MEDAVCGYCELIIAVLAIQNAGSIDQPHSRLMAARALRAIRPAKALQKFPAKIIIGEGVAKLDNGHRRFLRG